MPLNKIGIFIGDAHCRKRKIRLKKSGLKSPVIKFKQGHFRNKFFTGSRNVIQFYSVMVNRE